MNSVFEMPEENCQPGFAALDKALSGGIRLGEFWGILGNIPQKPGPKWDCENRVVDCSAPPRGPIEMEQVLRAYREGWTVILRSDFGELDVRRKA